MRSSASIAAREAGGASFPRPAGLRLMVPGWPQWSWSQRDRATVLFGSYIAALAVGLFAWGTLPGALILGFAFASHVLSAADALRQAAFPPFGRWLPWVSASTGLSLGYVPIFGVLWLVASPYPSGEGTEECGFLINRWSYRQSRPRLGDWVGFVADGRRQSRVGRLCGTEGQDVHWVDGKLTIDGQAVAWQSRGSPRGRVSEYTLSIPTGQVLIACEALDRAAPELMLLDRDMVVGRAWAQNWPIWSRRFLRSEQP